MPLMCQFFTKKISFLIHNVFWVQSSCNGRLIWALHYGHRKITTEKFKLHKQKSSKIQNKIPVPIVGRNAGTIVSNRFGISRFCGITTSGLVRQRNTTGRRKFTLLNLYVKNLNKYFLVFKCNRSHLRLQRFPWCKRSGSVPFGWWAVHGPTLWPHRHRWPILWPCKRSTIAWTLLRFRPMAARWICWRENLYFIWK